MKVILKADITKLGKAGSLIDVSDGYARNFLIPKGLAVEATSGKLAEWEAEQARMKAKDDRARQSANEVCKMLQGKSVVVNGKAGDNGKLFGSITSAQVAEALEAQYGQIWQIWSGGIDKRNVKLDETVKNAGNYNFSLKLYPNIQADMTLIVTVE